jgi:flagellar export protein FliJ
MKRFQFSLQPIRVLREQKERSTQQRFAEAMQACEEATYELHQASDALAEGWTSLCQELSTGVTATKLMRTRAWCSVLEHRQRERAETLTRARRAMDAALREMMLATRDREALDRYHDKCRRAHDREVQREEQKALDELGVRRAFTPGGLGNSRRSRLEGT